MTKTSDLMEYPVVARVLVGSQAHGLADEGSDYDYREVFYIPTSELLQVPISSRVKHSWDMQNKHTDDEAGWELGKFLEMCARGRLNVVELLFAPVEESIDEWDEVIELRDAMLCRDEFAYSTLGYGQNCLKKLLLREQMTRRAKWKSTYLRIMYAGIDFLKTGVMPVRVPEPGWGEVVRAARNDELNRGDVFNLGEELERELRALGEDGGGSPLPAEPDWKRINAWLLNFRHEHWK